MGQEQAKQLLQQAIAAARAGRSDVARPMLQQVIRLEPQNETAWLWLSSVAADNKERYFCLKKLLEINPQNEFAIKGLQALGGAPSAAPAAAPMPGVPTPVPGVPPPTSVASVPVLDDARYTRVMQAADEFLYRYSPQPPDRLKIQWTRRRKGRYSEGGARRVRQAIYATLTLAVVVLVVSMVFLVTQVGIFGGGSGTPVGQVNTRIPSQTPLFTLTPTLGGASPTPFDETMAVPATRVPAGLKPGNPYGLSTPTEIYPHPNTSINSVVQQAANYYSIGAYPVAVQTLQAERKADKPCYSSVVYYEALSQAGQGNYQDALSLLNWAQTYEPPQGYKPTCQDDPLILLGLAQVWYMQDHQSDNALTFAEQALAKDSKLIQASVVKAGVELARGQLTTARTTVGQALNQSPQDANLLLMAAEIEIASGQPGSALEYLGPVLYVEPALLPALYLQADAYLLYASQSQAGSKQQTELYGLAVLSAQTLLVYYPGDPKGYLYLAQARIGEGNDDMAETALTRIIDVKDSLPDSAQPVIQQAYLLRGDLLYREGRLKEAQADLKAYLAASGKSDPQVLERLAEIAVNLGDYFDASNQVDLLVSLDPTNSTYILEQARLSVEICTFYPQVSCQYRDMLRELTDQFIAGLSSPAQQAEAYSYRAQARYWDTTQRGSSITDSDRQAALQQSLSDLTQALSVRESAVDHYYRGLILEALGQPVRAVEEYQWLIYWSQIYPYPFRNTEFDQRVAEVTGYAQATQAAMATSTPYPTFTPAMTRTPTSTPTPGPTSTPTKTPTPSATPTATITPTPTRFIETPVFIP